MESKENHDISKELNKERYREDARLLEKAKEKMVEAGLFEKDFIRGLKFMLIDDHDNKEDTNYQLIENGLLIPYEESDRTKEVGVLTRAYLDSIDDQFEAATEKNKSQYLWLGNLDKSLFLSFDAAAVHEAAHAKSYSAIDKEGKSLFDKEKFKRLIAGLTKNDPILSKSQSIDLSKFDYSDENWSELYALLYHREFLRRENSDNDKMLKEWDNHIIEVAGDLQGAMKKFNREKGTNIDPEIICKDCHAFSFLLARVFEEKYKEFYERIKVLEQCKKDKISQ